MVSYLAHLQRWSRGCRQRFRGLRATSLCIHLGQQRTAAGECGGSADSSTRGRGPGCLHPAPRCPLLLGCRLMSVSLLGGCFLSPLIAAGLFFGCWLHRCDFLWGVLLLACGQVRRSYWPQQFFLTAFGFCIMPAACFFRPRVTCFRLPACCCGFRLIEVLVCVCV